MFETIRLQAAQAIQEILEKAHLSKGDLFIVGCSSSEVCGGVIGKNSSPDAAQAVAREHKQAQEDLDALYESWEELSEAVAELD